MEKRSTVPRLVIHNGRFDPETAQNANKSTVSYRCENSLVLEISNVLYIPMGWCSLSSEL